jgi:hypothetical protein
MFVVSIDELACKHEYSEYIASDSFREVGVGNLRGLYVSEMLRGLLVPDPPAVCSLGVDLKNLERLPHHQF